MSRIRSAYVAASSNEIARAERAMVQLVEAGINVTSTWAAVIAKQSGGVANPRDAGVGDRLRWSLDDLNQVEAADLLWMLAPSEGSGRGAYVELGYAKARHKLIIASGDTKQSIFGALAVEFETDAAALSFIIGLANGGAP